MSTQEQDNIYLNRMYEDVHVELTNLGIKHRRTKVDGIPRFVTSDYNPDRLNFETDNEITIEVHRG